MDEPAPVRAGPEGVPIFPHPEQSFLWLHPVSIAAYRRLTFFVLGELLALHEHRVELV